jgi:hypothetical protein
VQTSSQHNIIVTSKPCASEQVGHVHVQLGLSIMSHGLKHMGSNRTGEGEDLAVTLAARHLPKLPVCQRSF